MSAISALLAAASSILEERQELLLYSNLALPFIFFSSSKWAFIISTWYLLHPHTSVIKLTLESRHVSSWCKKLKKTVLSVLLLCVLTLSQWDAKYLERASIRKYSTGPKASNHDDQWKYEKCTKLLQNRLVVPTNSQLPGPTISTPQPLPVAFWNKFKIYQWNADGICPKFIELCDQLINSNIDILPVQESKLQKTEKTSLI